jgi:nitrogen regulatory protein PII
MKAIKAIVQPFMLSKVTSKLLAIANFPGMTVTEVQGFGREKAQGVSHRIVEDLVDYVPKTKIEIVASETMVDEIVRIILEHAHTGNKGDGKIFVYEVLEAVRIRTGETGESAL